MIKRGILEAYALADPPLDPPPPDPLPLLDREYTVRNPDLELRERLDLLLLLLEYLRELDLRLDLLVLLLLSFEINKQQQSRSNSSNRRIPKRYGQIAVGKNN